MHKHHSPLTNVIALAVVLVLAIPVVLPSPRVLAKGSQDNGSVRSPSSAALGPLENIPQTWNNCGPASVAEVLAYWGIDRTQWQVQSVIRADGNPYGTTPYGVPAYMRSLGMRALIGIAGAIGW